jgi:nitroreductase
MAQPALLGRGVLCESALDQLFRTARTRNSWRDAPVSEATLRELYELAKLGPTAANGSPGRFLFVTSPAGKARLVPYLAAQNRAKTLAAPVCVVIGYDLGFSAHLERLLPHNPSAAAMFSDPEVARATAFRNGTLQGAYFILAARALGLDCGPMSGFDADGVTREFFGGTTVVANFLCNLGYGGEDGLLPRSPRLDFDTACAVA